MGHYWPFSGVLRHGGCRERLIVSLDHLARREALRLVDELARSAGMFRIGKPLFNHCGPDLVREVRGRGGEVFLDLKFHDGAAAVARAAVEATRLGVRMFDLHPCGSVELMERARAEVARTCRNERLRRPHILAVAMLAGLEEAGGAGAEGVANAARLAADAALDGVLIAPNQTARVRALRGRRFIIATTGAAIHDCAGARAAGAPIGVAEAMRAGADYVVVGGPLWRAPDPLTAAREVLAEMERGLRALARPAPAPGGVGTVPDPKPG